MTEVQHELYKATLNKHMEILLNKEKVSNNIIIIHFIYQNNSYIE